MSSMQKLMKQGLIRFWRARTRSGEGLGIETLYLATRGYWPRTIDAETGDQAAAKALARHPGHIAYNIYPAADATTAEDAPTVTAV